jgi:hypothetical protein
MMTSQVVTTDKHRELTKFFGDYCLSSGESGFADSDNDTKFSVLVGENKNNSHRRLIARSDLSTGDKVLEDDDPENQANLLPNFNPEQNKVDQVVFDNIVYDYRQKHFRKGPRETRNMDEFLGALSGYINMKKDQ